MNPYRATLLNGLMLIAMSIWAWFATGSPSVAITAAFGLLFLLMAGGVRRENKIIAHVAVVVVVIVILALVGPLLGTIERGNADGIVRVGAMMLTSILALAYYVKSFIDVRRARS
jgi:hypothetical protein